MAAAGPAGGYDSDPEAEDPESWLGPDFLEAALRGWLGEAELELTRGRLVPAPDTGARGSDVWRAYAEWAAPGGRSGSRALFLKCAPSRPPARRRLARSLRFLEKERAVYERVLPAVEALLAARLPPGAPAAPPLAPAALPSPRPEHALVLEDLAPQGFRPADPRRGLNLEHCSLALRALGRLHAGSAALLRRQPAALDGLEEVLYAEGSPHAAALLEPALDALAREVARWPGYERFAPRIRALAAPAAAPAALAAGLAAALRPDAGRLRVMCHGDLWPGNILFRYDPHTGGVREVRFVDFQLSRAGSPGADLHLFLATAPSEVVRAQCGERLLAAYQRELAAELAAQGCHPLVPSLEQVRAELAATEPVGLWAALCVLPRVLAELGAPAAAGVANPRYRALMHKLLPAFEDKGLL